LHNAPNLKYLALKNRYEVGTHLDITVDELVMIDTRFNGAVKLLRLPRATHTLHIDFGDTFAKDAAAYVKLMRQSKDVRYLVMDDIQDMIVAKQLHSMSKVQKARFRVDSDTSSKIHNEIMDVISKMRELKQLHWSAARNHKRIPKMIDQLEQLTSLELDLNCVDHDTWMSIYNAVDRSEVLDFKPIGRHPDRRYQRKSNKDQWVDISTKRTYESLIEAQIASPMVCWYYNKNSQRFVAR
jgi:hypothetical protein